MRFLFIPEWLRKRVYREDAIKKMAKNIDDLTRQLAYAQSMQGKLERQIEQLTKNPEGASAEAWEQKYLSALTFIYATRSYDGYQQHLNLTKGHDYREDIKHYTNH